jgi:hypothetical protein
LRLIRLFDTPENAFGVKNFLRRNAGGAGSAVRAKICRERSLSRQAFSPWKKLRQRRNP